MHWLNDRRRFGIALSPLLPKLQITTRSDRIHPTKTGSSNGGPSAAAAVGAAGSRNSGALQPQLLAAYAFIARDGQSMSVHDNRSQCRVPTNRLTRHNVHVSINTHT